MWLGSPHQHGCVYSIGRWYARVCLAQPLSGVGRDKFVVSVPYHLVIFKLLSPG
jgi:hypothetical protein